MTGIGQLVFPDKANGGLIVRDGKVVGSELIGQAFSDPKYFWGRLSATGPMPYNAAASSGSNLGPTNPALLDNAKARIEALKAADPGNTAPIPVDLVTSSGSGLDPHITPAAAEYQIGRVAKARGLSNDAVQKIVAEHSEGRQWGIFGEPYVKCSRESRARWNPLTNLRAPFPVGFRRICWYINQKANVQTVSQILRFLGMACSEVWPKRDAELSLMRFSRARRLCGHPGAARGRGAYRQLGCPPSNSLNAPPEAGKTPSLVRRLPRISIAAKKAMIRIFIKGVTVRMIVNCVAYKNGRNAGDIAVEDISEALKQDGTFVWVGLHEPDEALLRKIQHEFGLHELAIEDAHAAHQHPKLEEYGDTLFVVLQTAQMWEGKVHFGETHIFVGRRFLVSVRHGPSLSYKGVRERCECSPDRLAQGPGFALYAIMDFIVDNYRPIAAGLHERLEILEADIFKQRLDRQRLAEVYDFKRQLLLLHEAAEPLLEICGELMRLHTDIVPKESRVYFRDILDHVKRITKEIDSMREMLTLAIQVHLALITVGQNDVVKKLAGWGAILAVPTMVFSLYGMNFKHMPELDSQWSYPIVLLGIAAGCVILYRRLRRAEWL